MVHLVVSMTSANVVHLSYTYIYAHSIFIGKPEEDGWIGNLHLDPAKGKAHPPPPPRGRGCLQVRTSTWGTGQEGGTTILWRVLLSTAWARRTGLYKLVLASSGHRMPGFLAS